MVSGPMDFHSILLVNGAILQIVLFCVPQKKEKPYMFGILFIKKKFGWTIPLNQTLLTNISMSLAMIPSTYFYPHCEISHKKMLEGNAKMRINSKNVHKKRMHTIELDKLFIRL